MNLRRDQCPTDLDDVAEMYCLGLLSPEDAAAFEDHCAAAVLRRRSNISRLPSICV